jgi:formate C-acetyltransferase
MNTPALLRLRNRILASDNLACFIERESLLRAHAEETAACPPEARYLHEFELLMDNLSTPIEPDDLFAGRMLEGRWPHAEGFTRLGLTSEGHITLPTPTILKHGLAGIAADVARHAERIGTPEARHFERQALGCIEAIRRFCERYAAAAERAGKTEMARALRVVPYQPAFDLYSALQSIWMVQFICSTVCGARDFAPGRLAYDLQPYVSGPRDETVELLAFFLIKFNEITGTSTDNYACKPVPCHSSKQYLTLGSVFGDLDAMIVEAAAAVGLPQPTLNFRLRDDFALAGEAAHRIDAQCNFFNDRLITNKLLNSGIVPDDAERYTFTACNRVDLPGRLYNIMPRIDAFDNSLAWFREALSAAQDVEGILPELYRIAVERMRDDTRSRRVRLYRDDWCFRFESLFFPSCIQTCHDIYRQGAENYRWQHRMFSGLANMADSLAAVKRLRERYSYAQILGILDADFVGHEALRTEILNTFPAYGNGDSEVDAYAAAAGNVLIDAFEQVSREEGFLPMASFYSLTHHARFGAGIGATPDGRKAGEPISENQSPSHGKDRKGPTALLSSAAALPHSRCICGGLNLKFGLQPGPDVFGALLKSYFDMGGLHIGFTVVTRETLEAARREPEAYRNLLVRKTGFSEFFVSLSPQEQQELIERTEY